jgi:hypothetical protein
MARRQIMWIIWAVYIVIFILLDFLIPYFLPRYAGDTDFLPFFFFFPFFWIGGRRRTSGGGQNSPQPVDDTGKDHGEIFTASNKYDYDEFGIPRRKNTSRIFYIIGAAIIIIGIAVSLIIFL